ncbi:DUF501 domain-containing protein [Brevibacterium sp. BDJS002]|uniref:DUF501 domain-containing protein n=1 Tax=Brevibacterium aurantiacum TaxID=273384 RepID=A0A2A3Z912_BREAU|nr:MULTISPECIES: DUF501 domain-containing protein [Brevibacterium]PCC48029.1 hypothetical protein CIK64_01995 [Brevibacterium aurantiacum]WCE41369.1 DUF501 domain-containing protein [Brevibacterium sp. BDJS002]SMX98161.1 hypothetical protein BAUR920_03113 [Brevibacterium aurantiacum]
MITECTEADFAILKEQLGRIPRGVVGIAARSTSGEPLVVATAPRLEDSTPFPTTFYLTHPAFVAECSRLEASGIMTEWSAEIAEDEALAAAYAKAHAAYLATRSEIGQSAGIAEVEEIKDYTAGGMPTRVKCLHALVGHSLAAGAGVNPIGDRAISFMTDVPTPAGAEGASTEASE